MHAYITKKRILNQRVGAQQDRTAADNWYNNGDLGRTLTADIRVEWNKNINFRLDSLKRKLPWGSTVGEIINEYCLLHRSLEF